jgi:hypothetical protein
MLTVNGIYDGEKIHLLQKVEQNKNFKVIVTFLEAITDINEIHGPKPYAVNDSFSFWEDSGENLYDDHEKNDPLQL